MRFMRHTLKCRWNRLKNIESGKVTINEIRLRYGLSQNEDGNNPVTTISPDNNKEQDCLNHLPLP